MRRARYIIIIIIMYYDKTFYYYIVFVSAVPAMYNIRILFYNLYLHYNNNTILLYVRVRERIATKIAAGLPRDG